MSRKTSRLRIPFPEEGEDPWFDSFRGMMNGVDDIVFSIAQDRNLIFEGGGKWELDTGLDLVSWSKRLEVYQNLTGFKLFVESASVQVEDGWIGYIEMARSPEDNIETEINSASSLREVDHKLDDIIILFRRQGDSVTFRNTISIKEGSKGKVFGRSTDVGESGFDRGIIRVNSDTALDDTDFTVLVNALSNPVTISIPDANVSEGRVYNVKKIDGSNNDVIIESDDDIDGSTNAVISEQYDSYMLQSDGTGWWII